MPLPVRNTGNRGEDLLGDGGCGAACHSRHRAHDRGGGTRRSHGCRGGGNGGGRDGSGDWGLMLLRA